MSRLGITFEEVADAASAIHETGETPTIDKIRTYLGGTGSNTTISKYLNVWRQQGYVPSSQNKSPTPDVVQAAVEQVWQQMRDKTEADIISIREEAQNLIKTAEEKAQTAVNNLATLTEQHQELEQRHLRLSAEKELLVLDLKSLTDDHNLLTEKYHGLEKRYEDMQIQANRHIEDLQRAHEKELTSIRANVKTIEEAHEKLLDEIKTQREYERHQYMLAIDAVKVENQKFLKEIHQLEQNSKNQELLITKLESNLADSSAAKEHAINLLNAQKDEWDKTNNHLIDLNASFQSINKQQVTLQHDLNEKIEDISNRFQYKISDLENSIKSLLKESFKEQHKKLSIIK